MLDKPQVNLLRQVRNDVRGIFLNSSQAHSAHEIQENQALEALLELGPKSPVRQLFSALPEQVSVGSLAGLLQSKPPDLFLHISGLILEVVLALHWSNPISDPVPSTASIGPQLLRARSHAHKTTPG